MTTRARILAIIFAGGLLFGCGGEEADKAMEQAKEAASDAMDTATDAMESAGEKASETMEAAGGAMEEAKQAAGEAMESAGEALKQGSYEGIKVIDQTKAEAEFRIKQSLAGVESLIEDIKGAGGDVGDLESQKAELQKKLEAL